MAYLELEELKTVVYEYQFTQITEGDDTIILTAIETAIEEVKSYLTANDQHRFGDGRYLYDVDAIFAAEGVDRNPLILAITKTVTEWWVTQLCNADIVYEQIKERYDRAIKWLDQLKDGKVNLKSLPQLPDTDSIIDSPTFRSGSREKFNHE